MGWSAPPSDIYTQQGRSQKQGDRPCLVQMCIFTVSILEKTGFT